MDRSELTFCPTCHAEISKYSEITTCNHCKVVVHAYCAQLSEFKCPNLGCSGTLVVQPNKINITVSGTSAQEVEFVARSLLNQSQTEILRRENENRISVLFLSAEPTNSAHLRLGEEVREIQEKIQLAKSRDRFLLYQRMAARPHDISQALLDIEPHIVHFSGHGAPSGALYLEDVNGSVHPIQPDALGALFKQFAKQVKCVVLNACYSESQAKAIAQHIGYVIGMSSSISDKAAVAFAVGLYQAIGANRAIDDAYKLGCTQIRLHNIPEYLTPVLIKRGRVQQKAT